VEEEGGGLMEEEGSQGGFVGSEHFVSVRGLDGRERERERGKVTERMPPSKF
jgi:hypothetical protein